MPRPFTELDLAAALPLQLLLLVATFVVGVLVLPRPRPHRIVSLALAVTARRAGRVLNAWRQTNTLEIARRSVILDFTFIPLYSSAIAVNCVLAGRAAVGQQMMPRSALATLAAVAPWAAWSAGVADVLENVGLLRILGRGPSTPVTAVTSAFAFAKFVVVAAAVLVTVSLLVTRHSLSPGKPWR